MYLGPGAVYGKSLILGIIWVEIHKRSISQDINPISTQLSNLAGQKARMRLLNTINCGF